jgi:exosortase C (VPDSG-CTERM-specific)
MNPTPPTPPADFSRLDPLKPPPLRYLAIASAALALCFGLPLYQLAGFAVHSDLYSHILLIPFVSVFLIWTKRTDLPARSNGDAIASAVFIALGAVALTLSPGIAHAPAEDYLAGKALSFLFFLFGISAWMLGRPGWRRLMFPLGFLIFIVPFPIALRSGLEILLQHGSAQVALVMFKLGGTSVYYHDLLFQLRGISLEVAPECSGLHSSLALFITSVIAGYFFLRKSWSRTVLSAAVVPLALLRNGFRIFTIGELCVHVSPDMINSYIHHQGGPIFFALSLIPFFLLLQLFHKLEPRR